MSKATRRLRYVVVEGPIGVGKTTLARRIASTLHGEWMGEQFDENPFLKRFYQDREREALPTQLFFLVQRARQLDGLKQGELFAPVCVADFMLDKDRLFASINLSAQEKWLYDQLYDFVSLEAPTPDLVIYLTAPVAVLSERIGKRARDFEKTIATEYLAEICAAYQRFFHLYQAAPVLEIDTTTRNFVDNDDDFDWLMGQVLASTDQ